MLSFAFWGGLGWGLDGKCPRRAKPGKICGALWQAAPEFSRISSLLPLASPPFSIDGKWGRNKLIFVFFVVGIG
jgi:hypothetical protein